VYSFTLWQFYPVGSKVDRDFSIKLNIIQQNTSENNKTDSKLYYAIRPESLLSPRACSRVAYASAAQQKTTRGQAAKQARLFSLPGPTQQPSRPVSHARTVLPHAQALTWAWAGIPRTRLGRFRSCERWPSIAIDGDPSRSGEQKPLRPSVPPTLGFICFLPRLSLAPHGERAASAATLAICAGEGDWCRSKPGCLPPLLSLPLPFSFCSHRRRPRQSDGGGGRWWDRREVMAPQPVPSSAHALALGWARRRRAVWAAVPFSRAHWNSAPRGDKDVSAGGSGDSLPPHYQGNGRRWWRWVPR
jgi:hypothetical protein